MGNEKTKHTPQQRAIVDGRQCPPCDGTRRGAAQRSAWFRSANALANRGVGKVVRVGGDCYRFEKAASK